LTIKEMINCGGSSIEFGVAPRYLVSHALIHLYLKDVS